MGDHARSREIAGALGRHWARVSDLGGSVSVTWHVRGSKGRAERTERVHSWVLGVGSGRLKEPNGRLYGEVLAFLLWGSKRVRATPGR